MCDLYQSNIPTGQVLKVDQSKYLTGADRTIFRFFFNIQDQHLVAMLE